MSSGIPCSVCTRELEPPAVKALRPDVPVSDQPRMCLVCIEHARMLGVAIGEALCRAAALIRRGHGGGAS